MGGPKYGSIFVSLTFKRADYDMIAAEVERRAGENAKPEDYDWETTIADAVRAQINNDRTTPEQPSANDWAPIENAPKDGTCVIVWPPTYKGRTSCARWDDDKHAKRPKPYWQRADALGVFDSRNNPPTHFRPVLDGPDIPPKTEA